MYSVHDTIAAVSSAAGMEAAKHIVRISGPHAFEIVASLIETSLSRMRQIVYGRIRVDDELCIETTVYIFCSPQSYTGDDLIELHICGPSVLIEAVIRRVFALGARVAGPGEFTARAYLNGKMDLAQAEAVAQIIAGSNIMQVAAAEKLLAGRLAETIKTVQEKLLELISRIEAGLDFAGEDIEFISTTEAIDHIDGVTAILQQLLAGSISCEEMMSLPAVGIAGAPNAGKSSLLNTLLGRSRSIVSPHQATTRDVLSGVLKLPHRDCAIFDCAGLLPAAASQSVLERLAQDAAIEAIRTAQLVIFCVDISKPSWDDDVEIFQLIKHKQVIAAAAKSDVPAQNALCERLNRLEAAFGHHFLAISSVAGTGIESLREAIDTELTSGGGAAGEAADIISLNQRHRHWLEDVIGCMKQAKQELMSDNSEATAMLLRTGYRAFGELSDSGIDDLVLERIFSRFCIGK